LKKIKDRILLGGISGVIASIPFQILSAYLHKQGVTDVPYGYSASKIFLTKETTKTSGGKVLSVPINFISVSVVGSLITYTLSYTGKDHAIIKGAGIGSLMWVGFSGLISNVGLNIKSKKPVTHYYELCQHALFGAICSKLITTLGDNSLFPDKNIKEQEKVPVIYTGEE